MSFDAVDWVIKHSETKRNAKFVLAVIAHHENGKNATCWPSYKRLAQLTGLTSPTVIRAVKEAEELGEVIVTRKTGGSTTEGPPSNEYVLPKYNLFKTVKTKPPTEADAVCRAWWDAASPKPMPAGGFVGARKIIDKALKAGWSSEEVGQALPQVETLAQWSLEKALKGNRKEKQPRNNPQKFEFWTGQ